jgi:hypothetical protein
MAGAFPALRNVTNALQLQRNYYVNTMSNAFPQLMWVGQYLDQYVSPRITHLQCLSRVHFERT